MTEYESYELAISLIDFRHSLGESVLSQIQFWAGVSYAILAITFLAPERLTLGATALLVTLYIAFSASTIGNSIVDLETAIASTVDAREILKDSGLSLEVVQKERRVSWESALIVIYVLGLLLGTIGYVLFVCRREYVAKKRSKVHRIG